MSNRPPAFSGYWFKVPREAREWGKLSGQELKAYLYILDSLRNTHPGQVSDSQLGEFLGTKRQNATTIARKLVEAGYLAAERTRGRSKGTVYRLPFEWKEGGKKTHVPSCVLEATGTAKTHGKTHVPSCQDTHVPSCEPSDSSDIQRENHSLQPSCSSSIGGSGGNATETTTTCPSSSENQNTETERLREILTVYRKDFGWKETLKGKPTDGTIRLFQKLGKTPDEIGVALESKVEVLIDRPIKTWRYVYKVLKTYFETESPEAAAKDREEIDAPAKRVTGDRAQGPQRQILEAEVLSSEPLSPEPDCLVDVVQYVARNGGYRGEAMAGWVAAYAGPEVKKSELQAWQERAHAALGHCPKCEDRGCTGYHLTPCGCAWAIGLGYRKPSPEELAEIESEVWL
jgi:hypothetical protein